MKPKLVIVESPSKSKTIGTYLGKEYVVLSSKGHVRDLAKKGKGGLGIEINNRYKPIYEWIPDKKTLIQDLIEAAKKASAIYLATDPDREGEAISWHLAEILNAKDKPVHRVIFNEITKTAILKAFEQPRDIDYHLVYSQEVRRVLDRIIGFELSKLLRSKVKSESAGRVQSAALKLIVDREKEINQFIIEEYYEIKAVFEHFEADLIRLHEKTPKLATREDALHVIEGLKHSFIVEAIETKTKSSESKPPFITSTLIQEASSRLNFTSSKTMQIAQTLYEGIKLKDETSGLITYMRTDSTRLSEDFIKQASDYIVFEFGKAYLAAPKQVLKKDNVQDAHEAIRPTNLNYSPEVLKEYLTKDQLALYQIIYARALASLMKPYTYQQTIVLFENNGGKFKTIHNKPEFDGYLKIYGKYESKEKKVPKLPHLEVGDKLIAHSVLEKQCFTTPPARYTEAKLIKEMEDLGIGRPSTYAQTIITLTKRKYVLTQEKKFIPTEQGFLTIDALERFFYEFISANYTKAMEEVLDHIAEGTEEPVEVVKSFYEYFIPLIEKAKQQMEKIPPKETGEPCPLCGQPLVIRKGKYGSFEGCSDYPKCRYIKKAQSIDAPKRRVTQIPCPSCQNGTLVERIAASGKNKGNRFLGCSNFPKCKFISPLKVVQQDCPQCGNILVQNDQSIIHCIDETTCGYHTH